MQLCAAVVVGPVAALLRCDLRADEELARSECVRWLVQWWRLDWSRYGGLALCLLADHSAEAWRRSAAVPQRSSSSNPADRVVGRAGSTGLGSAVVRLSRAVRAITFGAMLGACCGIAVGACGDKPDTPTASPAPSSDFRPGTTTITLPTPRHPADDFEPGTATITIPRTTTVP